MATVKDWANSNIGIYLDNATSRRDFRAQLRGNRSIMLWSIYLVVLIGLGMIVYSTSVLQGSTSVVEAQGTLQTFYQTVMYILGATVLLVAPALAASSIVIERERHSLDLIFSAPVKPKALLVGKMISNYRYTWMLLVLSLPITALCVVLGGQTWSQVLASYALLSFHAMLYSSMALAISAVSKKPVGALIYTYVGALAYFGLSSGIAETTGIFSSSSGTTEGPFWATLSPIEVVHAAVTHTTMAGIAIPNWILFGIFATFVTRLFLLGAASALSPYNSPETKNFRITGLVTTAIVALVLCVVFLTPQGSYPSGNADTTAGLPDWDLIAGDILGFLPLTLLFFTPFLSCSGIDSERKFRPNGNFSIKEAFRGTPAGGLPYIFMVLAVIAASVAGWCLLETPASPGPVFLTSIVWAAGFWTFIWSLGKWSSATLSELRSARTLNLALLIAAMGLPLPFLLMFDSEMRSYAWVFYPIFPLFPTPSDTSLQVNTVSARLFMGIALLTLGVSITYFASRKTHKGLAGTETAPVPA